MAVLRVNILYLCAFLVIGIVLAGIGNYYMDIQQPVRQQSQLLENYFIMQTMAGKNVTSPNLTYVVGNYGLVVSFNDVVSESGVTFHKKGPLNNSVSLTD